MLKVKNFAVALGTILLEILKLFSLETLGSVWSQFSQIKRKMIFRPMKVGNHLRKNDVNVLQIILLLWDC